MVDRLKDDHANAQILAKGLMSIEGISVDLSQVQTNIVVCDVSGLGIDGGAWIAKLNESGVKAGALEGSRVRMVTHRGIERDDIEYALEVMKKTAEETRRRK